VGDALGSVGAIVAGLIVLLGGPELADPVIGVGIGLFIVPRAWSLLRESVDVLLEAAPRDLDIDKMRTALKSLSGVLDVHDVHVWTITSGLHAVSAHITVADNQRSFPVMKEAQELLRSEFALDHSTLQVEPVGFEEAVHKLHR
jgi:cobalt-zinc-cadmium efflux system protein